MGIQGLLPALKSIHSPIHIGKFKGQKVAIDGYCWLHKGVYGCSTELCNGVPTNRYVYYFMHRINMLVHHGVIPVVVFDGAPLPMKKGTEAERRKARKDNLAKGLQFMRDGNRSEADECFKKAVDVTPQMAFHVIEELRRAGIESIVAPYEADAQLAFLARTNYVSAVITEDSDLLPFGTPCAVFKMDKFGSGIQVNLEDLRIVDDMPMDSFTPELFTKMCILSGCDYLKSLPGVGVKKAHKLLREHRTVEKAVLAWKLQDLSSNSSIVLEDYMLAFQRAFLTFCHQRVWDPIAKRIVHLTPLPAEAAGQPCDFLGPPLDEVTAQRICEGHIDPCSHTVFQSLPKISIGHKKPSSASSSKQQKKEQALPSQSNTMKQYFSSSNGSSSSTKMSSSQQSLASRVSPTFWNGGTKALAPIRLTSSSTSRSSVLSPSSYMMSSSSQPPLSSSSFSPITSLPSLQDAVDLDMYYDLKSSQSDVQEVESSSAVETAEEEEDPFGVDLDDDFEEPVEEEEEEIIDDNDDDGAVEVKPPRNRSEPLPVTSSSSKPEVIIKSKFFADEPVPIPPKPEKSRTALSSLPSSVSNNRPILVASSSAAAAAKPSKSTVASAIPQGVQPAHSPRLSIPWLSIPKPANLATFLDSFKSKRSTQPQRPTSAPATFASLVNSFAAKKKPVTVASSVKKRGRIEEASDDSESVASARSSLSSLSSNDNIPINVDEDVVVDGSKKARTEEAIMLD